jgi:DNA-binding transcriptional MerR regulator
MKSERLFGTTEVATILLIPEWRVKNFTQGLAYGLSPTQRIGKGRGSRRLYSETEIVRIALANELVEAGLTPEAVGAAIRELPESVIRPDRRQRDEFSREWEEPKTEDRTFLMNFQHEWILTTESKAHAKAEFSFSSPRAFFFLNVREIRNMATDRIDKFELEGE